MLRPQERRSVSPALRDIKEKTVIHRGKSRHSELISQGQIFRLISLASSGDAPRYTLSRSDPGISTGLWRIKYLSTTNVEYVYISHSGEGKGEEEEKAKLSPIEDARFLGRKTLDRSGSFSRVEILSLSLSISLSFSPQGERTSYFVPEERHAKTVRQLRGFVGFTRRRSRRVCLLVEIRQDAGFTGDVNGTPAGATSSLPRPVVYGLVIRLTPSSPLCRIHAKRRVSYGKEERERKRERERERGAGV